MTRNDNLKVVSPRKEVGDRGRRDRPLTEADGGGDGSKADGPLNCGLRSPGVVDALGDGDGELSETGRR